MLTQDKIGSWWYIHVHIYSNIHDSIYSIIVHKYFYLKKVNKQKYT